MDGLYHQKFQYPPETILSHSGSREVLELHGSVLRNYCERCGAFYGLDTILHSTGVPRCPACGGDIKFDVVLYEESLDKEVLAKAVPPYPAGRPDHRRHVPGGIRRRGWRSTSGAGTWWW